MEYSSFFLKRIMKGSFSALLQEQLKIYSKSQDDFHDFC